MKLVKMFFGALLAFFLFCLGSASSQILNVPEVIQEQSQWCWAAVSKCVLDYYGHEDEQCEIAEYTRITATWHDFGSVNCCEDPGQGCNYWNYNWGYEGSIEQILNHFAGIETNNMGEALNFSQIEQELINGRPFLFRWGYTSGGGHFLVGHGLSGNNIHYMDPWYNLGHMIADYEWVLSSGSHTWTHTQTMQLPLTIQATANQNGQIFPEGAFGVTYGGTQSFLLTPDTSFTLDAIVIDGMHVDLQNDHGWNAEEGTYTFFNIEQNHAIEAWFKSEETGLPKTQQLATRVYPNPATNNVWIESVNNNIMITNIILYDIQGDIIKTKSFESSDQCGHTIELNHLRNGIYVLKVFYDDYENEAHTIIKAH